MKNAHAVALGQLGKDKPKRISDAHREKLRDNLIKARAAKAQKRSIEHKDVPDTKIVSSRTLT